VNKLTSVHAGRQAGAPIVVAGVEKNYTTRAGGRIEALSRIDLTIAAGEFVAFVGPSGCGKTTLLNAIAGLAAPSDGSIHIGEQPVQGKPLSEIGYLFQKETLLPWYTVEHNVSLGLSYRGRKRDARARAHIGHLLEIAGLADVKNAYPSELSGGMRRRAALCAMLAIEPSVLLMDEPFGALDTFTRAGLQQYLLDLWSESRQTVVFVTHDLEEAVTLADRIVIFSKRPGRILDIVKVPLPRPRNVLQVKQMPEFSACYQQTWAALGEEFSLAEP
jgi:NitT/TauT family transport system ATP-binding protein